MDRAALDDEIDPGLRRLGLCDPAIASLQAADVAATVFDAVEADPPGVGGRPPSPPPARPPPARSSGSAAVPRSTSPSSRRCSRGGGEALRDVYGVGKAKGPRLPLILVPTTAGTGSEVTPISIVTTGAAEKMGVVSPVLMPDLALLDPELTLGLPPHVTAATGIDAMVHAIEAYASASANNNPISRMLACQALQLMGGAILSRRCTRARTSRRAADMLLGSMLAGQAFANSPVAAVHALAYPLGGHFHIPHGLSNALVLPHVLRFNMPRGAAALRRACAVRFPDLAALEGQARAASFIDALASLSSRIGLQQTLREVGIERER